MSKKNKRKTRKTAQAMVSGYQTQQTVDLDLLTGKKSFIFLSEDDGEVNPIYNATAPQAIRLHPDKPPIVVYPLLQFGTEGKAQAWYSVRALVTRPHTLCRVVETYDPMSEERKDDPEYQEGTFHVLWLNERGLVRPFEDDYGEPVRYSSSLRAWGDAVQNLYDDAKYMVVERLYDMDCKTSVPDLNVVPDIEELNKFLVDWMGWERFNNEDVTRAPGEVSFNGWRDKATRGALPLSYLSGMTWRDISIVLGWS